MMDKLYIRMCQGAREIQEQWTEPKDGDRYYLKKDLYELEWGGALRNRKEKDKHIAFEKGIYTVGVEMGVSQGYCDWETNDPGVVLENSFWLPRDEDLQQIFRLKNGNPDDYWILKSFLVWFSDLNFCHYRDVSINKLWLRYVMETIYNKRWNGTEWEVL